MSDSTRDASTLAAERLPGSLADDREPPLAPVPQALPHNLTERYQLLGEVGRGGMGSVLRGRDPALGRDLAIKVLLADAVARPDLCQRFREEAQVAGQLQHPGVVPVYELGACGNDQPYFTMKLVKGTTLAALLAARTEPVGQASCLPSGGRQDACPTERLRFLKVFEQVCQAVGYAHSKRVIHRDLKPSNVMVGAFGEVLVMDWGLAKLLGAPMPATAAAPAASVVRVSRTEAVGSTQEGDVLGTPAYMPPEQALGEIDRLDERCDVFALGAMLCQILTGQPPYHGGDSQELLRRARRADLTEAYARLEGCGADAELLALAKRCLAAVPDDRPRDGGAVAEAVVAYLAGVEERARQAERERAAAEARANEAKATARAERKARRLTLGLAAAALVVLVAGGSGAWWWQRQQARAAAHQQQADQKIRLILEQARGLLDRGWQANDLRTLAAALAESDKAVEVAHSGDASSAARHEATELRQQVTDKLKLAQRNDALMTALLDMAAPHETRRYSRGAGETMMALAEPSLEEQFTAAFRRWGVDIDHDPLERLAARLTAQPRPVVQQVVGGLEAWLRERWRTRRPAAARQRLLALADTLDRDERRRLVRRLLISNELEREVIVVGLSRRLLGWPLAALPNLGKRRAQLLAWAAAMDKAREPALGMISLAMTLTRAGAASEADALLRAGLAARPDELALLVALGVLRVKEQWLEEAIECFRAARALQPQLGLILAKLLAFTGKAAEGEMILRDLLAKERDNPELHFYLGYVLHRQKKLAEAKAAWRKTIILKPDYAIAHYNLGNVLSEQLKLKEAEAAFRKAIALQPNLAKAYNNLGHALWQQNKLSEAEAAFRKAIELEPDRVVAYNNLGGLLYKQKKLAAAEVALRKAIALQANFAPAYNNLGTVLADQTKPEEAEAAFRRAIALRPDSALCQFNFGVFLRRRKKYAEAEAAYRKAVQLQPDYVQAYLDLANVLYDQNKLAEAEVAFRKVIALKPDYASAYSDLGTLLHVQKRLAEAEAAYRKAIALQPNFVNAHYNLANVLRDQKKLAEAEAAYRKCLEIAPAYPEAHCNLGLLLRDQGRLAEAVTCLRRGHALGFKRPGWSYRSAEWVQEAEQLLELDRKLPAILQGKAKPAGVTEQLLFAKLCAQPYKQQYAASARFYSDAFAAEPKLAGDLRNQHRYNAACSAALAAAGKAKDAATLDAKERTRLRQQTLTWLQADLAAYTRLADKAAARPLLRQRLAHWLQDTDLAGVREAKSLADLPVGERDSWRELWADVAVLLRKVEDKK